MVTRLFSCCFQPIYDMIYKRMSKRIRHMEIQLSREHICQELREKVSQFRVRREEELEPIKEEIFELETSIKDKQNELERVGEDILELQNTGASGEEIQKKRSQRERLRLELIPLVDRRNYLQEDLTQKRREIDEQVEILYEKLDRGEIF
ncbi:unnamed protein product [Caenorhabditis auriculariae]|uniref:Uncharacterized protein n=1 Tax=Caenorhabditis auriculariae TaxID=2777116 RepID=A0A8S1HRT6_9PELO|nr:unnamed protein product [Caenorhabditis auriculariae]